MRVTSCCGCCSVKKGVVILGIYSIVSGIVFPLLRIALERSSDFSQLMHPIVYSVTGVLVIMGTKKRKSKFIFPLLSITFTNIVMGIPMNFVDDIQVAVLNGDPAWIYFVTILCHGCDYALSFHAYIVINTFYKELLSEEYAVPKIGSHVVENNSTSSFILVSPAVTTQKTPEYVSYVEK